MNARTQRYVTTLTVAAAVSLGAVVWVLPGRRPSAIEALLLVGGIALAERTEVAFDWDRTSGGFTLADVPIVAGLLLLPAPLVVAAVAPGVALAHLRPGAVTIKVVYNAAIATLGAALAAFTLHVLPSIPPLVGERSVPAAVVGMLAYGVAAGLGFAGLLARLQGRDTARSLRAQLPMLAASTLGSTAVGVVLAGLWALQPSLVPFVLAPAAAVHLAQRASIRAATSLASQRTEHARLVRVVDGASDGIILLDAEGLVQVWNPAMSRMTGRPSSRAVGRPVSRVLTDDVREGPAPVTGRWTLAEARPSAPVIEQEARLTDPDGVRRDVRESHGFTFDDRGRCTGVVVVVRDVSRQRELERLRSDFVARVSHELRTPLTPIRGFASVLLRRWELLDASQRDEALTRIVERTDHLHGLVEDLLLVTRLDQDDVEELVHAGPADLAALTRVAVDGLLVDHPGRTVTIAIADHVPLAHADADRARQILDAVLDNAARYTDPDTPIEVEVDGAGDDVRVRIVDHGPGIPPAEREAVFERFHRLEDPLTMRTSGVGVGLFLGRRLAEAMHGSLELEATPPGDGAAFVLRLPATLTPGDGTASRSDGDTAPTSPQTAITDTTSRT
ncbi:sensor histidine kinase [Nitriliruptor alkaliphilus]|uniref:sensor histidine kinase n=1 Tax=Nitriliruptor alkaliphilus TaxID=427918 RepID=UPI000696E2A6|nr:ATP-binding protein [Nitriliruptor alkaliphilus]